VGRRARRWSLALASIGVLGVLAVTAVAIADEEIFDNGKLRSDGVMTVGQRESVRIKGLPAKRKVRMSVTANDQRCRDFKNVFCAAQPAKRAAGTPKFRTNRKGRAVLTFVMPASYEILKIKNLKSQRLPFTNGQQVLVDATVDTAVRIQGEKRHVIGIAQAKAVAEVLAPSP
jgi:hypothetical protein